MSLDHARTETSFVSFVRRAEPDRIRICHTALPITIREKSNPLGGFRILWRRAIRRTSRPIGAEGQDMPKYRQSPMPQITLSSHALSRTEQLMCTWQTSIHRGMRSTSAAVLNRRFLSSIRRSSSTRSSGQWPRPCWIAALASFRLPPLRSVLAVQAAGKAVTRSTRNCSPRDAKGSYTKQGSPFQSGPVNR